MAPDRRRKSEDSTDLVHSAVTRLEYEAVRYEIAGLAESIQQLQASHEIQLRRVGELQAELDRLKASLRRGETG
jgi:hypothetical protein